MVPRTDGCGEQLLRRIIEVGRVNVRAVTWRKRTTIIENQTQPPLAWFGGGVLEGARAM